MERDELMRDWQNLYRPEKRPISCPRCGKPIRYVEPDSLMSDEGWEDYDGYLICDHCGLNYNHEYWVHWSDDAITARQSMAHSQETSAGRPTPLEPS